MAVVTRVTDERSFAETQSVDHLEHLTDPPVECCDHRGIRCPRLGQVGARFREVGVRLIRVVGKVEGQVEVERAVLLAFEESHGALRDQVGEVIAVEKDLRVVLPEVVERWLPRPRVEKPVRVVVDEAAQVPEELVEAEVPRTAPRPRSQVPLAEEPVR